MSIVTKTGDGGTTGLFGGERLPKDHPRIHAYGTVDELNAAIGVARATSGMPAGINVQLLEIQHMLFRVGGDLATPLTKRAKEDRVSPDHTKKIEGWLSALEELLPPQTAFILPGGSPASASLHLARTICRRAERWVVALSATEEINAEVRVFLNRLGDYLFLAARMTNVGAGIPEQEVEY
ncbi:MAG: ATP--cobalamin adenosyltransferase [Candidatus Peregrinibacteria bacterium Greene0416_19]|nr:MAG: ATP--cobalamin adenosyltransferase [Candidatus Peregrinibacteria bacterium Greene0416_19]